jgi:hypothetical protein
LIDFTIFREGYYSTDIEALHSGGITCDYRREMMFDQPKETKDARRSHRPSAPRFQHAFAFLFVACSLIGAGCSAVYPEMKTAVRPQSEGVTPDPLPAADLYYIYFEGAWVPPKDQGGLVWPGGAPDPLAKLLVDDVPVIVTPTQSKTREPTWPDQKKENIRIRAGARVFVEVWDDNPMTDLPICRAPVRDLDAIREGGDNEIWCDGGARVRLHVEPARAMVGIGLYYETRGKDGVRVTRVVEDSPAARAGLGPGDRILAIQGKRVAEMDALQVRSEINLHARAGLELDVWFADGKRHIVKLKEASLFPLRGDDLKLDE